jgi:diaminopimelate epimerase
MTIPAGFPFIKMSGSGNDFIFVDVREVESHPFSEPETIRALCARGTGVGADGLVLLERSPPATFAMRYFNADGTLASLCGNATLCAARLGVELGIVSARQGTEGFCFETGVGSVRARVVDPRRPEIELAPPAGLQATLPDSVEPRRGELRAGFVEIGVPHVVILCDDADLARVLERGPELRRHAAFPHGANVNFVSRYADGWRYRTFERGVENETLACGTGAAACALLLTHWEEGTAPFQMRTSSGTILDVLPPSDDSDRPRLRGDARIVYRGELGEL